MPWFINNYNLSEYFSLSVTAGFPLLIYWPKSRGRYHFQLSRNIHKFLYKSQVWSHLLLYLKLLSIIKKQFRFYRKVQLHQKIEFWLSVESPIKSIFQLKTTTHCYNLSNNPVKCLYKSQDKLNNKYPL